MSYELRNYKAKTFSGAVKRNKVTTKAKKEKRIFRELINENETRFFWHDERNLPSNNSFICREESDLMTSF